MLQMVLQKQKSRKYILLNLAYFLFFMVLYTLLDSFNLSYGTIKDTYGMWLVITNWGVNVLMAVLSALMMGFTSAQFDFSGKQSAGSNASYLSVFVGILTYGCTPCVISFFAAIGISFSVVVLPFAGLPYKFISILFLGIGMWWVVRSIAKTTCKIDLETNDKKERN